MKISIVKSLMIICVIAAIAGIPGMPQAIKIPPAEATVYLYNQKNYSVKIGCTLAYLAGSKMELIHINEWVSANGSVTRKAKYMSSSKIIGIATTVYFNGKTFRQDYNPNGVSSVTVVAVPDNLLNVYPKHMKVDIR
jgi:hypothetical protein